MHKMSITFTYRRGKSSAGEPNTQMKSNSGNTLRSTHLQICLFKEIGGPTDKVSSWILDLYHCLAL